MKTYLTIQHFQDQGGAASLRYRKPLLNHRSYVLTKSLIRYGFRAGARAFLYTVVIALDECFGNDRERTKRDLKYSYPLLFLYVEEASRESQRFIRECIGF